MMTAEQMEARRSTVGGSDIPILMGHKRGMYASGAFQLYQRKTAPVMEDSPDRFAEWGHNLEPVILTAYVKQVLRPLNDAGMYHELLDDIGSLTMPGEPGFTCTPDGIVVDAQGKWLWGVEAKSRSHWSADQWGPDGGDQVPLDVYDQVQWCMMVTKLPRWDVAALIGGNDFRTYTIMANPDAMRVMAQGAEAFLASLRAGEPPVPSDSDDALAKYPVGSKGSSLPVPGVYVEVFNALCDTRVKAKRNLDAAAANIEALDAQIKDLIGERSGVHSGIYEATWRTVEPAPKVDWKGILDELHPAIATDTGLIARHTAPVKPYRRFAVKALSATAPVDDEALP